MAGRYEQRYLIHAHQNRNAAKYASLIKWVFVCLLLYGADLHVKINNICTQKRFEVATCNTSHAYSVLLITPSSGGTSPNVMLSGSACEKSIGPKQI